MGRNKEPSVKRSVNINEDLYSWIESEAKTNCISFNSQLNMMLSKSKRIIEKCNTFEEGFIQEDSEKGDKPGTASA